MPRIVFAFLCFLNDFSHKKDQPYAQCLLIQLLFLSPSPKSTISSPIVTVKEGKETKKKTKTKIGVGFVVKAKVGELKNITREERSRRMRKEVVGYVQNVVGKKKFIVQFKDCQKKEIISSLLLF